MTDNKENLTFEEALVSLETIVKELEQGDIPLEQALTQFKKGIELSQQCENKLTAAEEMLTKIMNEAGQEVVFEGSDGDNG